MLVVNSIYTVIIKGLSTNYFKGSYDPKSKNFYISRLSVHEALHADKAEFSKLITSHPNCVQIHYVNLSIVMFPALMSQ